ncbi:MAG: co-chaperone GroES [Patescibacteria group bacterium]|nr:co-chaperone GroES [Patescibacteria group bacterium]
MAKIQPLGDRLVVKRLEKEQVTASGIVLPDSVKEKPDEGEVIAVGPGRMNDNGERTPLEVQAGDKVLFTKYGPSEVKVDGEELLILNESDVLAKIS